MGRPEQEYRDAMDNLRFTDKEKEHIMNNLMNQEQQNSKGKRIPLRAALLAAALAVGCVLSIAAGLPAQVYNFVSGGSVAAIPGTNEISMTLNGEETAPVKAEDGRLWFEADGQKLDITDKVDKNTPYIYERTDPATGEKGCVIVGGTVDNFGWLELLPLDDGGFAASGNNYDTLSIAELCEAQERGEDVNALAYGNHQPWLQAALDQLNIDF